MNTFEPNKFPSYEQDELEANPFADIPTQSSLQTSYDAIPDRFVPDFNQDFIPDGLTAGWDSREGSVRLEETRPEESKDEVRSEKNDEEEERIEGKTGEEEEKTNEKEKTIEEEKTNEKEKTNEEKTNEEKTNEEKTNEEKTNEEKANEEKANEEKTNEEKANEEKANEEKTNKEKASEEKINKETSPENSRTNETIDEALKTKQTRSASEEEESKVISGETQSIEGSSERSGDDSSIEAEKGKEIKPENTGDYDIKPLSDHSELEDTQSESLKIPTSGSRPYFEVTIEDPQKIGDAINAHIIYKVRTKTNSPSFRSSEFIVARRYRDFLWLYNQLTLGNPGVIVPPVPEKHALGRFQDDFVESRRIALERCLQKIVAHPMLYGDPDLKVFLESESFNVEKRQRRAEPESSKISFMRSFGETLSNATTFSKFVEVDEWFESKKNQLDALEVQLKGLLKSVEGVVKQRKELGLATSDFGESMFPLASAELNKTLSTHLMVLGEIQKKMKEIHEQQAQYDIMTLENTIDEYIRIIGSIRNAFNARIKTYQTYQQTESEYQKKLTMFEKFKQQQQKTNRSDPVKLHSFQQELLELKEKVDEFEQEFQDISKLIKNELDRFDKEKVEDFRDSVEQFLRSMIEHQKQIIALWETYFEQTEGLSD